MLNFVNRQEFNGVFHFLVQDDRCTGQGAVAAANHLITINQVRHVIGVPCSGALLAAAPIYERAGVIVISPGASSPRISQAGSHIFRTAPSDLQSAQLLADYTRRYYRSLGIPTT